MQTIALFHTGFAQIPAPDIRRGRPNADFGQGFYLSDNEEFSLRWARTRRGADTWLNAYELACDDLRIFRFERDGDWFDYIFDNRAGRPDRLAGYDVIAGPIANDTLYDTWGVITCGLIEKKAALRLLLNGPLYTQTAIKTEKAAAALRFAAAKKILPEQIADYRAVVRAEEKAYQEIVFRELEREGIMI